MVVIRVQPMMDEGLDLPDGYSYLVQMDGTAQTMQLADAITDAQLFESKQAAADFWNSHMSRLLNPPMVNVTLETPTLH